MLHTVGTALVSMPCRSLLNNAVPSAAADRNVLGLSPSVHAQDLSISPSNPSVRRQHTPQAPACQRLRALRLVGDSGNTDSHLCCLDENLANPVDMIAH